MCGAPIEPLRGQPNVLLIDPVGYPELVFLLKQCHFVVTDSGGIQEEAPSFGKPVLVTRDTTERPEAMELGLARLVGTDERRLFDEMTALLDDHAAYSRMSRIENPYGDGRASRRIASRLDSPALPNMRRRLAADHSEKATYVAQCDYPNIADANEATAAHIAAHNMRETRRATAHEARLVRRNPASLAHPLSEALARRSCASVA